MKINPKATYRLGVMRSDSHPQDPDPRLVNPQTVSGLQLTNAGIFDWAQFFMQNPLNIQKKGTIEVFTVGARGDLKHAYSGTFFSQPVVSPMYDQQGGAMHNAYGQPMPIGMNGLGNQVPGRNMMMPNQTESMQAVFNNAQTQMERMEERHRDELERMRLQIDTYHNALNDQYQKNATLQADLNLEREQRIKAEHLATNLKFEYEVKERERLKAEQDAVKLAKDHFDSLKKQGNGLNDANIDKIAGLFSSAVDLIKGSSTNTMQPSISQNTSVPSGMADAAKAAAAQYANGQQRNGQAPPAQAANVSYQ